MFLAVTACLGVRPAAGWSLPATPETVAYLVAGHSCLAASGIARPPEGPFSSHPVETVHAVTQLKAVLEWHDIDRSVHGIAAGDMHSVILSRLLAGLPAFARAARDATPAEMKEGLPAQAALVLANLCFARAGVSPLGTPIEATQAFQSKLRSVLHGRDHSLRGNDSADGRADLQARIAAISKYEPMHSVVSLATPDAKSLSALMQAFAVFEDDFRLEPAQSGD